jgi:Putative zinc-finger
MTAATTTMHHDEALALLPWYANATLSAGEQAALSAHLDACTSCRAELARCTALAGAVEQRTAAQAWAPSDAHWLRVQRNVQHAWRASAAPATPAAGGWLTRLRHALAATPRPVRWTLAAQGGFAFALAVALVAQIDRPLPQAEYETLSQPDAPSAAARRSPRLLLAAADDLSEQELRALLAELGATIVGGPNTVGVYTLALPAGSDAAAVAARLSADSRLRFVRAVAAPR